MAEIALRSRENIWKCVYTRTINPGSADPMELTPTALLVFAEVDGRRRLSLIASKLELDRTQAIEACSRLLSLNLIKEKVCARPLKASDFRSELEYQLTSRIGPMAKILIQDAIRESEYVEGCIDNDQASELVELLSFKIRWQKDRIQFIGRMVDFICGDPC